MEVQYVGPTLAGGVSPDGTPGEHRHSSLIARAAQVGVGSRDSRERHAQVHRPVEQPLGKRAVLAHPRAAECEPPRRLEVHPHRLPVLAVAQRWRLDGQDRERGSRHQARG